jgi:hypothetical protein
MKRSVVLAAAALCGTLTAAASARAAGANTTTLAVYGDWPYSTTLLAQAPLLLASINSDPDVSLVMHVGDIHSGSMPCTPEWNRGIFDIFQQFADPFVYTPGDNEWTDCHKAKESSSGAPLAELASIRALFFPVAGQTLGANPRRVLSEAQLFGFGGRPDGQYVENVIWTQSHVLFVTLNLPGSNNDTVPWTGVFSDPAAQAEEVANRTAADLHWLELAFVTAKLGRARGVVVGVQANMWDPAALAPGGDGLGAYTNIVHKLADLSVFFGRPVLLINGDTHVFEVDQPLADPASATGVIHGTQPVPNLTRITVEGSTATKEWLKLTVDPASPAVFSWQRIFYLP